jgi:hypothetical protein
MNVFSADAFSAVSLTKAADLMGFVPGLLGSIPGLFENVGIRTTDVWIERRGYGPALIQTTPRGAPPAQKGGDKRDARSYRTVRLALASRIYAEELQNIRAYGTELDLKDMQMEVARRMMKLTSDHDLTEENLRLGCVQGVVKDADGSTIVDWTAEFATVPSGARAMSMPTEVAFNFAAGTLGSVRTNCNAVVRTILRNLQGMGGGAARVVGLADDTFFDALVTHPEVRATFLNWSAAADLRSAVGEVFHPFTYAGIEFINYRGTDDNSSVAVPTGKCKFFPRNAGIFQIARAPAEKFEFVNTLGQARYSWTTRDVHRDMWADIEMLTYPLPVCVLPQALVSGRLGS